MHVPPDAAVDGEQTAEAVPGRHSHTYFGKRITPASAPIEEAPGMGLPADDPESGVVPPARTVARPGRQVKRWQPHQPQVAAPPVPGPVHPVDVSPGRLSGEGLAWVAAHGGCGATTLTAVLGGVDLGCRWPQAARNEPARVLLVARTHAQGLRAASRALNAIREGRHPADMQLMGLVLVADAPGGLPRPLLSRIKVLRSAVPVYRIPWIPAWRIGKKIDRLPRQVTKLEQRVRAVLLGARMTA
ncbi:DUF6668 family protein [Pseudosporangium ferrugineum]|uniref:Uncharacterized protein n=1 Tax=Pseudosporangium ferrugineum TaxID=439699 RepID=A0A2T0S835_9ACTN|nr:DUF6668 family protein [Pseudosporangium ferrugineum]PRY29555.1 hypothetical protein CLV70_106276 [Pseudosporangium ferrugineum]